MRKLAALSVCIFLVCCVSFSSSAMASDEEDVLKVMTNWFKAQSTNDFELMSSLWWHSPKTSQFSPWKSGALLTEGWDVIAEGMKAFYEQPKGTWSASMRYPQVMMLGDNAAIITSYNVATGNPPAVKEQTTYLVRGTFVVQKIGGKWLIVYEHSSMVPEE